MLILYISVLLLLVARRGARRRRREVSHPTLLQAVGGAAATASPVLSSYFQLPQRLLEPANRLGRLAHLRLASADHVLIAGSCSHRLEALENLALLLDPRVQRSHLGREVGGSLLREGCVVGSSEGQLQ